MTRVEATDKVSNSYELRVIFKLKLIIAAKGIPDQQSEV